MQRPATASSPDIRPAAMPTLTTKQLWDAHPYPASPCDTTYFVNQCAIRMSVALRGAGADLGSFVGAKCYPSLAHSPRHALRAQELADWLATQTVLVGTVQKHKAVTHADFVGKKGIVFIKDGWGPTDHIDVWDGEALKGGSPDYFARGKAVWFWELA
jgi:hypothetical protein